jgi:hypothetical protein
MVPALEESSVKAEAADQPPAAVETEPEPAPETEETPGVPVPSQTTATTLDPGAHPEDIPAVALPEMPTGDEDLQESGGQPAIEPASPAPDQPPQMVTVVLRASGDKMRDILRIRRIHGTLISSPGTDRFAFYIVEAGRNYSLEFPNFTTGVSEDLLGRLKAMVGVENVRVEKITIQ